MAPSKLGGMHKPNSARRVTNRARFTSRAWAALAGISVAFGGLTVAIGSANTAEAISSPQNRSVYAETFPGTSAESVTVDLAVAWDESAPNPVPAGHQVLANFTLAVNDVPYGTAGTADLTVVVEGVNAGFASWAQGTVSNGGRTLTISFPEFALATSQRIGFALIGDQQGEMGAEIRVYSMENTEVAAEGLTPLPVLPGKMAWDVVLSRRSWVNGVIQRHLVGIPLNFTIDRASPIPKGDLSFDIVFTDANSESAIIPATSRYSPYRMPLGEFSLLGSPSHIGDEFVVSGGEAIGGYLQPIPEGWRVTIPADKLNPFADIPRGGNGVVLDPDMRVFATLAPHFSTNVTQYLWTKSINFAVNIENAVWGGVPESDRGTTTEQCGVPSVNNRACHSFTPEGSFVSAWQPASTPAVPALLWGESPAAPWGPTSSLQTNTAVLTAPWSAADYIPYGSEIMSQAETSGSGYVAACLAIDPDATPFAGRVIVSQHVSGVTADRVRLYATTAPINLATQDCATVSAADWLEVPLKSVSGERAFFELDDDAAITAVRAIAENHIAITAMHYAFLASPNESGWMTARGWWPRSSDINDLYNLFGRGFEHVHTATSGELFASTNQVRDIVRGNYGFPRITKSVSTTTPKLGEIVTFTIRAINLSNAGHMELVVHDEMDTRLELVPNSVTVAGAHAADPLIGKPQPGSWVGGSTVVPLTFDLGARPVNEIVTVTYQAVANWDVGKVSNTAWMVPTREAQANGFTGVGAGNGTLAQVDLARQLTGNLSLTKEVAKEFMSGTGIPGEAARNSWQLAVNNGTSAVAESQVIDIFPYHDDGRGTTTGSTHQLQWFSTDHPVTVYHSFLDPQKIDPDPGVTANANPGAAASHWQLWREFPASGQAEWDLEAQPTALLLVAEIRSGATAHYDIGFSADVPGAKGRLVNYSWQRDNINQLRLVRASATIAEFPEVSVTKT
ncbi:MAG: isopeptide-forming domain-containing fimbrial protein, partial [Promicromonosporaceae bacterium]|nr:isopeptide-forming domain-containing fimbrial protein [Promicromonosporaceae bacterium]